MLEDIQNPFLSFSFLHVFFLGGSAIPNFSKVVLATFLAFSPVSPEIPNLFVNF